MPVEVGLEMYAEKPVVLPFFTGYVARGLLLHAVRMVDPVVSGVLHELDVRKPYSVTPLRFKSMRRVENGYELDPQAPCFVRFRFLKDELSAFILSYFQKQNSLMVFDTVFRIASLSVNCKSYVDLEKEAAAVDRFRLLFKTPSYFASLGSGFHWMFPDAVKVFSGLMRVWNLFSDGKRFSKEEYLAYKEWLSENVGVCEYELHTRLAVMRKKKTTGFVGWVTYEMRDKESEWNRVTAMLAKYAEYANVGGNRTGGFGLTRFLEKKA
ncbi:CRISPR system precrRNA processing endoribonuclease RAMP protein Cas6 [Candidatus Bathyarchaeota archaeon A05DMB-2]|nr:CRISPR system precrRNA processing endoribonuclease RAMP protein Cas6 [Candidatus Bathyarchaeota archaeon A05DMB-2]